MKRYWIRVLLVVVPILALIGGWAALQQQPRLAIHAAASHLKWTIQQSGNTQLSNNVLNAVAASSEDNVWAVGWSGSNTTTPPQQTLVERRTGATTWKIVSSPSVSGFNSLLNGVAVASTSNVWAVGHFEPVSNTFQTLIEHWNGSQWKIIPSPNPSNFAALSAITALAANNIWAVGSYNTASNVAQTLIEHWNGSSWKVIPSPNGINSTFLTGVSAASAKDIWAVGVTNFSGTAAFQTFTIHWNGSVWKVVPSPDVAGTQGDFLSAVAVVSSKNVWAVGSSSGVSPLKTTLTLHWNGSSWKIVSSPNVKGAVENELLGVASAPDDVIAVGDATIVTGPKQSKEVTLVEKYS